MSVAENQPLTQEQQNAIVEEWQRPGRTNWEAANAVAALAARFERENLAARGTKITASDWATLLEQYGLVQFIISGNKEVNIYGLHRDFVTLGAQFAQALGEVQRLRRRDEFVTDFLELTGVKTLEGLVDALNHERAQITRLNATVATLQAERDEARQQRDEFHQRLEAMELDQPNALGAMDRERQTIKALKAAGVPPLVPIRAGLESSFPGDRVSHLAKQRDESLARAEHSEARFRSLYGASSKFIVSAAKVFLSKAVGEVSTADEAAMNEAGNELYSLLNDPADVPGMATVGQLKAQVEGMKAEVTDAQAVLERMGFGPSRYGTLLTGLCALAEAHRRTRASHARAGQCLRILSTTAFPSELVASPRAAGLLRALLAVARMGSGATPEAAERWAAYALERSMGPRPAPALDLGWADAWDDAPPLLKELVRVLRLREWMEERGIGCSPQLALPEFATERCAVCGVLLRLAAGEAFPGHSDSVDDLRCGPCAAADLWSDVQSEQPVLWAGRVHLVVSLLGVCWCGTPSHRIHGRMTRLLAATNPPHPDALVLSEDTERSALRFQEAGLHMPENLPSGVCWCGEAASPIHARAGLLAVGGPNIRLALWLNDSLGGWSWDGDFPRLAVLGSLMDGTFTRAGYRARPSGTWVVTDAQGHRLAEDLPAGSMPSGAGLFISRDTERSSG